MITGPHRKLVGALLSPQQPAVAHIMLKARNIATSSADIPIDCGSIARDVAEPDRCSAQMPRLQVVSSGTKSIRYPMAS